ncbi:dihydroneopterin aldolase [filamentous cyanobacterium LEGE 11480]|uniref:7,8-dihydroneopterin aldolase n=1 Tax=Romeriopsis navalis LEGE 11480 TaxID=2777977 RepID=A0A928VQB6_9CYAN|nr:dihydroneopterin aldolase [Romeriopsis navalis]MBE9032818.1 dihydroneopterin aldolase [Romeriopsis navalis LEGE 11480]
MTDRIELSNIRCYGYTGFLPEEQVLGQWFEVDLIIDLDLSQAGQSDDLQHTLDYRGAIEATKTVVKDSRFALVERLAAEIASKILAFAIVQQVRVRLHKPAAPIPDFGGKITIDITRQRNA